MNSLALWLEMNEASKDAQLFKLKPGSWQAHGAERKTSHSPAVSWRPDASSELFARPPVSVMLPHLGPKMQATWRHERPSLLAPPPPMKKSSERDAQASGRAGAQGVSVRKAEARRTHTIAGARRERCWPLL